MCLMPSQDPEAAVFDFTGRIRQRLGAASDTTETEEILCDAGKELLGKLEGSAEEVAACVDVLRLAASAHGPSASGVQPNYTVVLQHLTSLLTGKLDSNASDRQSGAEQVPKKIRRPKKPDEKLIALATITFFWGTDITPHYAFNRLGRRTMKTLAQVAKAYHDWARAVQRINLAMLTRHISYFMQLKDKSTKLGDHSASSAVQDRYRPIQNKDLILVMKWREDRIVEFNGIQLPDRDPDIPAEFQARIDAWTTDEHVPLGEPLTMRDCDDSDLLGFDDYQLLIPRPPAKKRKIATRQHQSRNQRSKQHNRDSPGSKSTRTSKGKRKKRDRRIKSSDHVQSGADTASEHSEEMESSEDEMFPNSHDEVISQPSRLGFSTPILNDACGSVSWVTPNSFTIDDEDNGGLSDQSMGPETTADYQHDLSSMEESNSFRARPTTGGKTLDFRPKTSGLRLQQPEYFSIISTSDASEYEFSQEEEDFPVTTNLDSMDDERFGSPASDVAHEDAQPSPKQGCAADASPSLRNSDTVSTHVEFNQAYTPTSEVMDLLESYIEPRELDCDLVEADDGVPGAVTGASHLHSIKVTKNHQATTSPRSFPRNLFDGADRTTSGLKGINVRLVRAYLDFLDNPSLRELDITSFSEWRTGLKVHYDPPQPQSCDKASADLCCMSYGLLRERGGSLPVETPTIIQGWPRPHYSRTEGSFVGSQRVIGIQVLLEGNLWLWSLDNSHLCIIFPQRVSGSVDTTGQQQHDETHPILIEPNTILILPPRTPSAVLSSEGGSLRWGHSQLPSP